MYETTIFWWSFTIMGKSANISACFAAWTTLVLFLSLCVCVCVCTCLWFLWTWPPWAISLHSSRKQTAKETQKTFHKSLLLGDLDRRNIPKRFSSWSSWRKKHSQEFFLLKILTETFARILFLKILTETFPRVFFLKKSTQNFGIYPMYIIGEWGERG
jgi:hypothetical protein